MAGSEMVLLQMLKGGDPRFEKAVLLPDYGIFYNKLNIENIDVLIGELRNFCWKNPLQYLRSLSRVYRVINEYSPDVIHSTSASPMQYIWPVSKLLSIPLVCHIHCPYGKDDLRRYFPHRADKLVTVSKHLKNIFSEHNQENIIVNYNGIETILLEKEEAKQNLGLLYGIDTKAPVAGMVGQVIPRKGVDLFIKAAATVVKSTPNAQFIIVGNDQSQYADSLKELARSMGVEQHIIWTGYVEQPQRIMAGLDLLAAPSRSEGFGLVAAEALSVKTPVIASRTGGLVEIVEHGKNGFLFPYEFEKGLAHYMSQILQKPSRYKSFGDAGHQKVKNVFSPQKQMETIHSVYLSLSGE